MSRRRKNKDANKVIELSKDEIKLLLDTFANDVKQIFGSKDVSEIQNEENEYIHTDIRPLDTILGGGFVLRNIAALTSPSETGKTTIAWQIIKKAQEQYPDAFVLYLDIEGSALISNPELGIKSRVELLNIDTSRLVYTNEKFYLEDIEKKISELIDKKIKLDEAIGYSPPLIIIWDSISSTETRKIEDAERPEELTGYVSRTIQFIIGKLKRKIHKANALLLLIDQVRSNIEGGFFDSKSNASSSTKTGVFGKYKSSIGSTRANHEIRQWLFMEKGSLIRPQDIPDIDGWYLKVYIVKNKTAATTNMSIELVFDKRYGIDKFWSEYHFISEYQPFEKRLYKDANKFNTQYASKHPLGIQRLGGFYKLSYKSPIDGKTYEYPKNFRFADAKKLYTNDPEFKKLFDIIVEHSVRDRIINHISNIKISEQLYDSHESLLIENDNVDVDK